MAFGRNTTAELIKPLEGSIIRRYTAGATIAAGEIVSRMADGYVDPADTAAFTGSVSGVFSGAFPVGTATGVL